MKAVFAPKPVKVDMYVATFRSPMGSFRQNHVLRTWFFTLDVRKKAYLTLFTTTFSFALGANLDR
jgi:hypothetical protein